MASPSRKPARAAGEPEGSRVTRTSERPSAPERSRNSPPTEPPPPASFIAASGQSSGEVSSDQVAPESSCTVCSVSSRLGSVGAESARAVDSVMAVAWTVPKALEKSTAPSFTVRMARMGAEDGGRRTEDGLAGAGTDWSFTPNSVPRATAVATSVRMA
ncbi:MAG: hypothetical protein M5U12_07810 [Verrucomicrobia bacterium]|nr:hypothetical protein [Verrucomicrobiota bacterium]